MIFLAKWAAAPKQQLVHSINDLVGLMPILSAGLEKGAPLHQLFRAI